MMNYRDNSNEGYENEPLEHHYSIPINEAYVPWPSSLGWYGPTSFEGLTAIQKAGIYTRLFERSIKCLKRPPVSGELWELKVGFNTVKAFMYVKVTPHKFLLIGDGFSHRCVWTPPPGNSSMMYKDLWWPEMLKE